MSDSRPVTLRGLLSMTAGIGVPGYLGYAPGAPLPNLTQTLDGVPPANSPPVRVEAVPGRRYAYSGGGFEIVQAIIQDATDFAQGSPLRSKNNAMLEIQIPVTLCKSRQKIREPALKRG